MSEIIRSVKKGIEYFTVQATGESGISITGIGELSGVSKQAISNLIKNLSTSAPSKWLESFVGKDLHLSTTGTKNGGELKIIKAVVVSAIIRHYAIERKLETAILALSMFADAGITFFIQQMTGWKNTHINNLPRQLQTAIYCEQIYQRLEQFNPRIAQMLVDDLANSALQKALPENPERLLGVMEIAASMSYKVPNKLRSSLGRYVARHCAHFAKVEQRMVNGLMCDCKLYPANNSFVRGAITEYVRGKGLTT